MRRLLRHRGGVAGLAVLTLLLVTALGAPILAPHDPLDQRLTEDLRGPSPLHPLGQDKLGRDILSRIIHGSRVSLLVGTATVAVSLVIGVTLGGIAGYRRGWIDELAMRVVDVLLAFPGILLAIGLAAILGPSTGNVILALAVIGWTGYARLVRGEILSLREREFVLAAEALGAPSWRVLCLHLLPAVSPLLIVQATFGVAAAVVAEASLSFLGLGVPPPTPSWGHMVNEGRHFLLVAPHLAVFPGLAILVTIMGLNLLGDALRDVWDVRENEPRAR